MAHATDHARRRFGTALQIRDWYRARDIAHGCGVNRSSRTQPPRATPLADLGAASENRENAIPLAEQVNVSRNSINSIENGKFDPSLPLAFRIADAFGLTVEEVFPREGEDAAGAEE